MQLCQIHFYQKIARKKVARVNAALGRSSVSLTALKEVSGCWVHVASRFSIDPENPCGPAIAPLRVSIKSRRSNSLARVNKRAIEEGD